MQLRPATAQDVPSITATVCEAYVVYIERIGKRPGPMLEDFDPTVRQQSVHVATDALGVAGVIVLEETLEGFFVDNVAVRPRVQGTGVGKCLLQFAEQQALSRGYTSLFLATHELMTENLALYQKVGYVPFDRRLVQGFPRVFLRKQLPVSTRQHDPRSRVP